MDLMPPEEWPKTLRQAVERFVSVLTPEQQKELRETMYSQLGRFHHGWGTWIRNQFGLWGGNGELLEDCGCPQTGPGSALAGDSASYVILEAAWRHLRGMLWVSPPRLT